MNVPDENRRDSYRGILVDVLKVWIPIGMGVGLIVAVCLFGSDALTGADPDAVARNRDELAATCRSIAAATETTDQPPPTEMPALVAWLRRHASVPESVLRPNARTLTDGWGSRLVLLVQAGRLVGLGSPGPNRTWENGHGDDLTSRMHTDTE